MDIDEVCLTTFTPLQKQHTAHAPCLQQNKAGGRTRGLLWSNIRDYMITQTTQNGFGDTNKLHSV